MRRYLATAVVTTLAATALADDAGEIDEASSAAVAKIEAEICRAMEGGKGAGFAELREMLAKLPPETRRTLSVAVRPGVYEWRFSGTHPAGAITNVEYLASSKIKNYESLVVVEGAELKRLQLFGQAFNRLHHRRRDIEVDAQLTWSAAGKPCTVGLWEICPVEAAQFKAFKEALNGNDEGIGATNLDMDKAALPVKETSAQVIVTIRVP